MSKLVADYSVVSTRPKEAFILKQKKVTNSVTVAQAAEYDDAKRIGSSANIKTTKK